MEYEVQIEITYKYEISKIFEAASQSDAKQKVKEYFEDYSLQRLESEWGGFEEPSYVGDRKIISIEEW